VLWIMKSGLRVSGRGSSFYGRAALSYSYEFVNDSSAAAFHYTIETVLAVYCSAVLLSAGWSLRETGGIVEIAERLYCRPCGLHGRTPPPRRSFPCALDIEPTIVMVDFETI